MRIRDWSSDVCSSDLGVSSLTACAAALGHPIAARNDVLTVIPAPLDDATITARLQATDAAAILKLGRHGPRIVALLHSLGLADAAHYIERPTMANQRILPLAEVDPPAAPHFKQRTAVGREKGGQYV